MKSVLACVLASLSIGLAAELAAASSVLGDVEKGLRRIDQKLCAVASSRTCKPKKAAPAKPPDPAAPEQKAAAGRPIPIPRLRPAALKVPGATKASLPVPVPKLPPVKLDEPHQPSPPALVAAGSCEAALKKAGAVFVSVPQPSAAAECQIDQPVKLSAVVGKGGSVKLPDEPVLNCRFALAFANWISASAQPLAKAKLGAPITGLGTGPGFDCRDRRGDGSGKVSEHGTGDAVDIASVNTADAQIIAVRDAGNIFATDHDFLAALRASACGSFTTVLGPGANSAHAEHFHVDLAQRQGGYRICE